MSGLSDVESFLSDKSNSHVIHIVTVTMPDVAVIRTKSGLSQKSFAQSIGVAIGTLQGWEQGHRWPEGPARVLLVLIG